MINEKLLQFLWGNKYYHTSSFQTVQGQQGKIIHAGFLNYDAGADFQNAKIELDGILWAGNIEIDVKSSNWFLHKHHQDKSHENTILQVVWQNDLPEKEYPKPMLVLSEIIHPEIIEKYELLYENLQKIPCENLVATVKNATKFAWIERMGIERLEQKHQTIATQISETNGDWEEVFYRLLFRNFGFNINADNLELLANLIPLKTLEKHGKTTQEKEALLYGAAGFLQIPKDDYMHDLKKHFGYISQKIDVKNFPPFDWKFSKTRPTNFPSIRLSQLANLFQQNHRLFSFCLHAKNIQEIKNFFIKTHASEYWDSHYVFGKTAEENSQKFISEFSTEIILINTVIPMLFAYGKYTGNANYQEKALDWMTNLKAEKNKYITAMKPIIPKPENALESQGILHLYKNYCSQKKCLDCSIGAAILKQ